MLQSPSICKLQTQKFERHDYKEQRKVSHLTAEIETELDAFDIEDDVDKEEEDEDEEDEEVKKEKELRKKEKKAEESSEGEGLKKTKFVNEDSEEEKEDKEEPKQKKVYLIKKKKKVQESEESSEKKTLNEAQVGDTVLVNDKKGYITGTQGENYIVQIQGDTVWAKDKDMKILKGTVETIKPPFNFDEKTQKVLFEQFVKCGIFQGEIPIKTTNCYVKYSKWKSANTDDTLNVMVEGQLNILPKNQIKIFENEQHFANPDDYVEGVIIDPTTEEAVANVLLNAIDYTEAIGDAEMVRVIRDIESENPEIDTIPKSNIRTTSI